MSDSLTVYQSLQAIKATVGEVLKDWEAGDPGVFVLDSIHVLELLDAISKKHKRAAVSVRPGLGYCYVLIPTKGDSSKSLVVALVGTPKRKFLRLLEETSDVDYGHFSIETIVQSLPGGLWKDLARKKALVAFASLAYLAVWGLAANGGRPGDPVEQVLAGSILALSSVLLAVFSLYSGFARMAIRSAHRAFDGMFIIFRDDRVVLSWIVLSILAAISGLMLFCAPRPFGPIGNSLVDSGTSFSLALGAGFLGVSLFDATSFLLGREFHLSALSHFLQAER